MASVILNIQDNMGYSVDQVESQSITLADLKQALDAAIERFGDEAKVVLHNGQQYGASYGYISQWTNVFEAEEPEEGLDF